MISFNDVIKMVRRTESCVKHLYMYVLSWIMTRAMANSVKSVMYGVLYIEEGKVGHVVRIIPKAWMSRART